MQGKVDLPLEFAGEQRVKNISRPIRAYRVNLDGARETGRLSLWKRGQRKFWPVLGILLALSGTLGGVMWLLHPVEPALTVKPSVAVLPFDNLGGDEATGRLADGITEDIITDLARFPELDVVARNSTGVFKGKAVDSREVSKALNVGYVLEGSIQREDDRVRITAQLIDGRTGAPGATRPWATQMRPTQR